jgi:hypothetical protein
MVYKISHYGYSGTGFSTKRVKTPATWKTKRAAQAAAKEMNKFNKGINARVVKA